MTATGPPEGQIDALADIVIDLVSAPSLDAVLEVLLDRACQVTRSAGCAVYVQDAGDQLRRVHDRDSGLPEVLSIGDVRSAMWAALLGRTTLRWTTPDEAPQLVRASPGWERGMVLAIPSRAGERRVIVLDGAVDDVQARAVERLVAAVSPVIENLALSAQAERNRLLLRRVTELTAGLTTAESPAQLLDALVGGLTAIDVIDAAVVWRPDEAVVAGVEAESLSGMGDTVLADEPSRRRIGNLLRPDTGPAMRALLSEASTLPDGRLLTLLPIPVPANRVVGLVHTRRLSADAREVFSTLAGSLGPAISQAELARERQSLVAAFSRVLRPQKTPAELDIGVEHHPNTRGAESFGGDFYDWFEPTVGRVVVAIGDVSGKGIPAAAASSMAVWSLRAVGRQGSSPGLIAHLLDTAVAQELGMDRFVTLALLEVDTIRWQVRMVLAGHPAPLQLGPDVGTPPPTADRPLGVMPTGPAFSTHSMAMAPGDVLVLFTDGVTDALSESGERLGRERLERAAHEALAAGATRAGALAEALWDTVHAWAGGAPDDDCALIALRRP